jgi:hypothetical protein
MVASRVLATRPAADLRSIPAAHWGFSADSHAIGTKRQRSRDYLPTANSERHLLALSFGFIVGKLMAEPE